MTRPRRSLPSRFAAEALRRDIDAWEPRVEREGISWREVKRLAGVGSARKEGGSHTQALRIVENHIRHEMTDYDAFLERMRLKYGDAAVKETYWFALDRVTPRILEAFPELQFRNPRNEK